MPSKDEICTYTHRYMNPLDAKPADIVIDDIAHALSLMTRANGHFPEFYSVGQHCICCHDEAKARGYSNRLMLACLLHDAGEAYLSDVTRPIKHHMDYYNEVEGRLLSLIYTKFLGRDLTEEEAELVKSVDDAMLYHEFLHYMDIPLFASAPEIASAPVFRFEDFKEVEKGYLARFHALKD